MGGQVQPLSQVIILFDEQWKYFIPNPNINREEQHSLYLFLIIIQMWNNTLSVIFNLNSMLMLNETNMEKLSKADISSLQLWGPNYETTVWEILNQHKNSC